MTATTRASLVALALLLLGAGATLALDSRTQAIGAGGERYSVLSGTYTELFPTGHELEAETPVLALETQQPGAATVRLLVPGTRGSDIEGSPYLLLDKSSDGVLLVWESRVNVIHCQMILQSFSDGTWSQPIVVSGSTIALRGVPRVTVTRDSYQQRTADGTFATHRRTVIHLTWWEETSVGFAAFYSPLVLIDGTFLGWNETFNLSALTAGDEITPTGGADLSQLVPPTTQLGRDIGSVVIGFTNLQSNRLVSIEVRSLSPALGYLAEDLRSFLLPIAASYFPNRIEALGDQTRDHLLATGSQFDPEVLAIIADKARSHIIETGHAMPTRPLEVVEKARSHIIETGARLVRHGLRDEKGAAQAQLVEVASVNREDGADRPVAGNVHWLELRAASAWPLPAAQGGNSSILLSEDGAEAIVAWPVGDRLAYRETSADATWAAQNEIQLTSDLTLDRALATLERRLRSH